MNEKFIGKLEDLKDFVKKSGDNNVYRCPYCESNFGIGPDKKGKFYFNLLKQIGHCFRCGSIVIGDRLTSLDILKEHFSNYNKKKKEIRLNIKGWVKNLEDYEDSINYLSKRKINLKTAKRFNIGYCENPFKGIVFMNKIKDGLTDYLQIRMIESNNDFKHFTPNGLIKKCCWLDKIDDNNIIICEGFFSGLAAYQHSLNWKYHLNPIVLVGNDISEEQILEIKEKFMKKKNLNIFICMDGGFFYKSIIIGRKLYKSLNNCIINLVWLPGHSDPNELETKIFLDCLDNSFYYEPIRENLIRESIKCH